MQATEETQSPSSPEAPIVRHDTNAELWDVSAEEYHADYTHLSCSALSVFQDSIPAYYRQYISRQDPRKKSTDEMQLGSAMHVMLLEPENFKSKVVFNPTCEKRSNADKETWRRFREENAGKIQIDEEEIEVIERMVEAIFRDTEAKSLLLQPGLNEQAVTWHDPFTNLPCKLGADKLLEDGTVLNIKTCADPYPEFFARQCLNFGYHRSAAWYQDGVSHLPGHIPMPVIFIVVSNVGPNFECIVYELDDEAIDLGRSKNRALMTEMRDCLDLDNWTGRLANRRNKLSMPRWAFSNPLAY